MSLNAKGTSKIASRKASKMASMMDVKVEILNGHHLCFFHWLLNVFYQTDVILQRDTK